MSFMILSPCFVPACFSFFLLSSSLSLCFLCLLQSYQGIECKLNHHAKNLCLSMVSLPCLSIFSPIYFCCYLYLWSSCYKFQWSILSSSVSMLSLFVVFIHVGAFLTRATQLYTPLCWLVDWFFGHSLLFLCFFILWLYCTCPNALVSSNMPPAHRYAISEAVYPALFS